MRMRVVPMVAVAAREFGLREMVERFVITKRAVYSAAVIAALGCLASSASAATLVYNDTTTDGSANYPGTLIDTFKVNQGGLEVLDLAAFDSGKNGITAHIMVGLYDDTTGTVAIAPVDFNGTAYNGTGGSFFDTKAVTPFVLTHGDTYSVEAWGFSGTNLFRSGAAGSAVFSAGGFNLTNVAGTNPGSAGEAATNIDGNTTGGLFNALFGNTTAYSTYVGAPQPCEGPPSPVTCTTDGPLLRFNGTGFADAGSLEIGQTPIPAALPLFAGGLGILGLVAGRKRRKVATTAAT